MLSAFGVVDGQIGKALTDTQKHDVVGAGVAGGAAYGYQAVSSVRARNTAQRMSDPKRAHGVAQTLAENKGHSLMNMGIGHPIRATREQGAAYRYAAQAHPDVKHVRDSADRWSSSFRQVNRIRGAYDRKATVPGLGRALVRPIKAKAESDSNVMRNLGNAKTASPTLYRGMRTDKPEYKVGDHVHMHDLSSWSADHSVAELFAVHGKESKGFSHVFEREPGHATSLEAASPQFLQREWVGGGAHKVIGHTSSGAVRIARIVKSATSETARGRSAVTISAFGVQDTRISKAYDSRYGPVAKSQVAKIGPLGGFKIADAIGGLAQGAKGLLNSPKVAGLADSAKGLLNSPKVAGAIGSAKTALAPAATVVQLHPVASAAAGGLVAGKLLSGNGNSSNNVSKSAFGVQDGRDRRTSAASS